jgi:hypothetical protein
MSYLNSRFKPLLAFNHQLTLTTNHLVKLSNIAARLEAEKSLTILPNCFPTTAFKISGGRLPVEICKIFAKSIVRFQSPTTPSLRELRVLLGIMRLAIKSCHYNEFDEGGVLITTLSNLKASAGIGSNLNDIKSSLLILSQILFVFGDEENDLLKFEQHIDSDSGRPVISLELHPVFTNAVLTLVHRKKISSPTLYSIYYINDLQEMDEGLATKTAQALYIYYSSTINQGKKSFQHSKNNLCEKIYNLEDKVTGRPKITGGKRRQLVQGIWRLVEVGWQVTNISNDIYIVSRRKRHSAPRRSKIVEPRSRQKWVNSSNPQTIKKRPDIVRAKS